MHEGAWERLARSPILAPVLGPEIRRRRKSTGCTQEQLAERARISPHYLSTIETGKRDPSLSIVTAIAKALGTTVGDLLGGAEALSPAGVEAARLFERMPAEARDAVMTMMRLLARPARARQRR